MIAPTDRTDEVTGTLDECPLDPEALNTLIRVCPGLLLDGESAPAHAVGARIASFWLPDEVAVYIGRAGQAVGARVRQYYRTPIGAPKPHAGGWWIKTLRVLPELWVDWARTPRYVAAEEEMLRHFSANVSPESRAALPPGPVMPWANLVHPQEGRKAHGIRNATSAATGSARRSPTTPP